MNIQLVQDFDSFVALRTAWNKLLSRSSADTIFLTWEWLVSWWESYAAKNELHIIAVREDNGELVGILPLYRQMRSWFFYRPIRSLRFIGDGSWDSDYLDAILLSGREAEVLNCVWKWLDSKRASWDLLELVSIPETSPCYAWLKCKAEDTQIISRSENIPCLVIELPESWDDYLASLKPRFRTKVRSTLREIHAQHEVRFKRVETQTDLQSRLEILYDLHAKRWESKGAEGVFRKKEKRHFYETFAARFLSQGWLAFDFLELDGNPVACQMCFKYRGTQFLLQEGFDPEFSVESVGIALRTMVLKKAIDEGVRRYDFLAGGGRHKTQWCASAKNCRTIYLGRRSIASLWSVKVPSTMESWRERLKSVLPAKAIELRRRLASS